MKHLWRWCTPLALLIWTSAALAQGLAPRPSAGQRGKDVDKPAGPAEAAPEDEGAEPELPPLPAWPGQEHKKLQFFQLNGYFRFRADLLHNFNLGQVDVESPEIKAPFHTPLVEHPQSQNSCAARVNKPVPGGGERDLDSGDCPDNTLAGANIRLRLEPTINVAEKVRIHAQLDVFDNLMLGSTPNAVYGGPAGLSPAGAVPDVPLSAFSDGQAPPVAGRNTNAPAIVVKRAWGEVLTPLGRLEFGRMPVHWGLGMMANDGGCWDCNFGDDADRISFSTNLANHVFSMGYEFAANGPTNLGVSSGLPYYDGQVVDLEQLDDVDQLFWVVGRIDKPEVIEDRLEQGDLVLNYGLYLLWRKQDFGYGGGVGLGSDPGEYAANLVERGAWTLTPDIWVKLLYKILYLEFEGVLVGGEVDNVSDDDLNPQPVDILQFGWVMRSQVKLLRNALKIGLEVGMASGDEAESANSDFNRRRSYPLTDVNTERTPDLNEFRFDYDYHVDLILFRELIGTVANATYFKPSIQYDLLDTFGGRLDIIYSLANLPVAFPGNSTSLGLEFDLDLYYRNVEEGFYAGVQYGLLIPFGALDRPAEIFGDEYAKDAEVAQTLQARLIIKY